jgi:glycosyltransferase involved in cell wall biosynthesis
MKRKLSVLLSVKNESKYISEALDSIERNHDIYDIEIVIVDDGSNDDTCQIIKDRLQDNIKLIETNGIGKANAYSMAYELSTGEYFILFAGDDKLRTSSINARLSPLLKSDDKATVTFSKMRSFSENQKYDGILLPKDRTKGMRSGSGIAFNKLFAERVFPIPSVLPNEDSWIMLFTEFLDIQAFEVPIVGLDYRIHADNSYKRGGDFTEVKKQQWIRARSTLIFYARFWTELSTVNEKKVLFKIVSEILKYYGSWIVIAFLQQLTLIQRIKLIFNSNSFLYSFRELAYKFFSGR